MSISTCAFHQRQFCSRLCQPLRTGRFSFDRYRISYNPSTLGLLSWLVLSSSTSAVLDCVNPYEQVASASIVFFYELQIDCFGLAPQTFGLVTSSNSLPKGQPSLFIFVSPWLQSFNFECKATAVSPQACCCSTCTQSYRLWSNFFPVVCNPCLSSPSLTIIVPLWSLKPCISLVIYSLSDFFQLPFTLKLLVFFVTWPKQFKIQWLNSFTEVKWSQRIFSSKLNMNAVFRV